MSSLPYFEQIAGQWDNMRKEFFSESVREKACRIAGIQPGKTAADIGAGTGFMTEALLQNGLSVTAIDQSPAMLEYLRNKFPQAPLDCREVSGERLPVTDNSVDYVFANMFLHHAEDPFSAIMEMARILKPGGMLIITDLEKHHHEFLRTDQFDRWLGFETHEMSDWYAKAGLEEISVHLINESCCGTSSCGCEQAKINIWIASGVKPVTVQDQ